MRVKNSSVIGRRPGRGGFTIAEVVISVAIAAISIGAIISGYVISANRAEWTLCSSAAQLMVMNHLEQTKTARWDSFTNELDPISPFSTNEPLDIPITGTGVVDATNTVTITDTGSSPPSRLVRVDCVWSLMSRGPFTNTAFTLRFQEQ